ncbi:uncharacterized protein SCHCODRAFT_01109488 [Schizophyllum commune H4-8]|nr:uncharacterized protein SCHCODRAFT_01109488 [Schizophyllum commune H4-8]KAI5885012.1 hypothetical protein SCHCODRAFT_01109488 [Schizophyllum commune H4-8]
MTKTLDLESTYGPFMIVLAISWAFWGVLVAQMCTYYNDYADDSRTMKSIVALVWIADTAQKVLISSGLYRCVILNFGRSSGITEVAIMDSEIVPHLAVALIMQGFFYLRIYKLSRSYAVIVIYIKLSNKVHSLHRGFASAFRHDLRIGRNLRSKMQRFGGRLDRLSVVYRSGTWTAIFALVTLTLYEVDSSSNYYIIFNHSMCSVYSCTLLANLNARNYLRSVGDNPISIKIISFGSSRSKSTTTSTRGDASEAV